MRRIARRFGAAPSSEMVAAETYLEGDAEASMRAEGDGLAPHAVQLVGREARALAETARRVVGAGAALVDINMGCPARRVAGASGRRGADARPRRRERLIATVVEAVSVPVTVKMRLGWDETSLNAPELARRAERAGRGWSTVHGADPRPVLRRPRRLGCRPRGGRGGRDPGYRQRRLRDPRGCAGHARALRRRRA